MKPFIISSVTNNRKYMKGVDKMGFILDMLSLVMYMPFLQVDEEDISRNAKHLKKYVWFQNLLNNKHNRELIIHHKDVRQVIGKFNIEKLHKKHYNTKCERKLNKVLRAI
ncbi:hypothetical protein [Bacillus sp. NPDC077027]|uniref:hypothetical protein n=1 Tax=Bacillus sp. NPDC077027 TaxID=3390548 RepID=UPI003D07220E